jgi:hypothetical protein
LTSLQDELATLSPLASIEHKREELIAERKRLREQPHSKARKRRLNDIETHLDLLSQQEKQLADIGLGQEEPGRLAEVQEEIARVRAEQEQLRGQLQDQTELAGLRDARALEPVVMLLADPDVQVREAAARCAAAIAESLVARGQSGEQGPADQLRGPLLQALGSAEPPVRMWAARALGYIGGTDAVAALVRALDDEAAAVRWQAALSLGDLRATAAVDPLVTALRHQDPDTREAAAEALGAIGDPRAAGPLQEVLSDGTQRLSLRMAAARALGDLGDPASIPALAQALHDDSAELRVAAALALGDMDDAAAIPPLNELMAREQQRSVLEAARQALIMLGSKGLFAPAAPETPTP